jgi:protein-tyrosine phosphatase
MLPLIDTHCHLHAGLDDGPRDWGETLEMCRIAWQDGVQAVAATAHQNPGWPDTTAERIRSSTHELRTRLEKAGIPLAVYACGEVMIGPNLLEDWLAGRLVSVADAGRYLLIEMPHGVFLDIRDLVADLVALGVRPILAHPERFPELLFGPDIVMDLICQGCLMQVCADGITGPDKRVHRELRHWLARGWVHSVASDGHSPEGRRPVLSAAFDQIAGWTSPALAERVCCSTGMAILEGLPLVVPHPQRPKRSWFPGRR